MKRYICLLLALLMAATLLIGCADSGKNPGGHKDPGSSTDPGELDDKYNVADDLPDRNFGGRPFNIAYRDEKIGSGFYMDDRTGDVIGNAVYDSVSAVEQRFDVNVSATEYKENEQAYTKTIQNAISTGDGKDFDVANMHDSLSATASLEGYFMNLYNLEHIDFSKPWWSTVAVKTMTFQNKLYLASSAMSYSGLGSALVLFFNKDMFTTYGLDMPYETVLNGDWYLEDLLTMTENFYFDANENNQKDTDDIYGIMAGPQFYFVQEAFGIHTVQNDSETLSLLTNMDNLVELTNQMKRIFLTNEGGFLPEEENDEIGLFANNHALFVIGSLNDTISTYRGSDVDYGIIPLPKLNESQKEYYAPFSDRFFVVPNNNPDPEFTGFMLEALSAQGYRTIYPAYFENSLKTRYAHDPETREVLDMIQEHRVMSFAYIYTGSACFGRTLYNLITGQKGEKSFTTFYAENEGTARSKLEEIQGKFDKLQ